MQCFYQTLTWERLAGVKGWVGSVRAATNNHFLYLFVYKMSENCGKMAIPESPEAKVIKLVDICC